MSFDESITQPLTARLESFDGTEENRRNSPSPHTMLASSLQNGSAYHHYANPQQLKNDVEIELAKLDGRKKKNLLYDSVNIPGTSKNSHLLPPRNTNNSSNNNIVYVEKQRNEKRNIYKCILFCAVILVLAFFAAAVVFFVLSRNGDSKHSSSTNKLSDSAESTASIDDATLHQLQHNITHLTEHVIPSLQEEIKTLRERKPVDGKQGLEGPQGPPGVADFTKCSYKSYEKKNIMKTNDPESSETISTYIPASTDKFIMGITCSSRGAAQYGLIQRLTADGLRQFACRCAGKSSVTSFQTNDNFMYCIIHFWECPMTS